MDFDGNIFFAYIFERGTDVFRRRPKSFPKGVLVPWKKPFAIITLIVFVYLRGPLGRNTVKLHVL